MVKLDSVKLSIPRDLISGNSEKLIQKTTILPPQTEEDRERVLVSESIPKSLLPYGISSFQGNQSEWLVELSSKVLKENYLLGISKDTIENVFDSFDELEKKGLIKKEDKLMDHTSVYKCDITETISLPHGTIKPTLDSFSFLYSNNRFFCKDYGKESLVFQHTGSSVNERLILYDKVYDLGRFKKDEILTDIRNKLLDEQKDFLRVETNIRKFSDIRKYCNLKKSLFPPKLKEILDSKEKPVLRMFDKILSGRKSNSWFNEIETIKRLSSSEKISDVITISGIHYLLEEHDYDLNKIRKRFQSLGLSPSSISKQMIHFYNESTLQKTKNNKSNLDTLFSYIDVVRSQLNVA